MTKILYNTTGKGLNLTERALSYFKSLSIEDPTLLTRHDPDLIGAFEALGDNMSKDKLDTVSTDAIFYRIQDTVAGEQVVISYLPWICTKF